MVPSFRRRGRGEGPPATDARGARPEQQVPASSHGQAVRAPIVFYSKTGCPWANAVRHVLDANGVAYEERNARQERRFMEELLRETRQSRVPTLKIGDEWLVDTDARAVARHLGLPEPARVLL